MQKDSNVQSQKSILTNSVWSWKLLRTVMIDLTLIGMSYESKKNAQL